MIEKNKYKIWINFILIGTILSIMIWVVIEEYKDSQIKKEEAEYQIRNLSNESIIIEQKKTEEQKYPKEEVISEYKGYRVIAKLEIPSIDLETYVLEKYSINALNVSVTKFWGAEPNEVGNFCVAGHNFQNEKMFRNLKNLKIGNRFFISNNNIGKIEYEIYNIYKVYPEDVSCLSQETNGKREVTLITCTNDSEQRIIVKARELD